MPKNAEFHNVIIQLRSRSDILDKDKCDALDALLNVDLKETNQQSTKDFRKSVVQHKEVWGNFDELEDYFFGDDEKDPEGDDFLDPQAPPTFNSIAQKAAEERVKLGLAQAELEVIVGILKNNDKACREYLARQLKSVHLKQIPEWPANVNILTDDVLKRIKIEAEDILVKNYISSMEKTGLEELGKIDNVNDFQKKWADLMSDSIEFNPDFIHVPEMEVLKKAIYEQQLKLKLESSPLGEHAHSELMKSFRQQSFAQQRNIIENEQILVALMNSADKTVLTTHLENNVESLASENERYSNFKKIHNTTIARVLASYQPLISVTSPQIEEINRVIAGAANKDLSKFTQYKSLIHEIRTKIDQVDASHFDAAFDIQNEALKPLEHHHADDIKEQHEHNKVLLNDNTLTPQLKSLLLRVEKNKRFETSDILEIKDAFTNSKNINEFFQVWPKGALSEQQSLKDALKYHLSNELFLDIKQNQEKEQRLEVQCVTELKNKCKNTLTDEMVLSKVDLLNQENSKPLLFHLINDLSLKEEEEKILLALPESRSQEVGKEIQQQLCERYLKSKLHERESPSDLRDIFKTKNKGELINKLDNINEFSIINHAVTETNLDSFKITLLQNYIRKDMTNPNSLMQLEKQPTLEDFKRILPRIMGNGRLEEINVNFIKDADLEPLKREIRSQQFQLMVDSSSRLGKTAHSELIKLFDKLPSQQQKDLIAAPEIITSLMKSTEKETLQKHLGNENVDALIEEIKRYSNFNLIQSPAVAKALLKNCSHELSSEQIKKINDVLQEGKNVELSKYNNLSNLIDKIKVACNVSELDVEPHVIKEEYDNNRDLFTVQSMCGNAFNKPLMDMLLRIDKTQPIRTPDIEGIKDAIGKSNSVDEFFKHGLKNKDLKEALMKELTPEKFHQIKIKENEQKFREVVDLDKADQISQNRIALEKCKKENNFFKSKELGYKPLMNLEESHAVALQGKPRSVILQKQEPYLHWNNGCEKAIKKLENNLKELDLLKLPQLSNENNNISKAVLKLNKEIETEQMRAQEEIAAYTKFKNKIEKKLEEIEKALTDSQRQIYTPEGVKVYRQNIRTNDIANIADRPAIENTSMSSQGDNKELFKLVGTPSANEVICFETTDKVYVTHNGSQKPVDVTGSYRYVPSTAISSGTYKGDQLHRPNNGKLEILKFPQTNGSITDDQLKDARVNFAMKVVMQELLKRLDNNNPPSKDNPITIVSIKNKEDEAKYLWGACIAYGISPDAVLVKGNSGFNPNDELIRRTLRETIVKETSIYKTDFEPRANSTKQYIEDYQSKVQEKVNAETRTQKVDRELTGEYNLKSSVSLPVNQILRLIG